MNPIRLVPNEPPPPLATEDARQAAKVSFGQAKTAQMDLVADLYLTKMLHAPGQVTYHKLKGMRYHAQEQVDRARAVVDALTRAIEAMESATRQPNGGDDHE